MSKDIMDYSTNPNPNPNPNENENENENEINIEEFFSIKGNVQINEIEKKTRLYNNNINQIFDLLDLKENKTINEIKNNDENKIENINIHERINKLEKKCKVIEKALMIIINKLEKL